MCFGAKSNTPIPCPIRWFIFPNHPLYQQHSVKMVLERRKAGFVNPEYPPIWFSQSGPVLFFPGPNISATKKNEKKNEKMEKKMKKKVIQENQKKIKNMKKIEKIEK